MNSIQSNNDTIKMTVEFTKCINDRKDVLVKSLQECSDPSLVPNIVESAFSDVCRIVNFYNDVQAGKWIKVSDATPDLFGLDWVLVQFVEKSGFVGLPHIAELDRNTGRWRIASDDKAEQSYVDNDCVASSWKGIEASPEWKSVNQGIQ